MQSGKRRRDRSTVADVVADWPCSASVQEGPGELATPRWPLHYAANLRCTWRISAPAQHRVRLQFTDFELDRHELGHCTDQLDHVRLLDGGTLSAPVIGLYCGHMHEQLTVLSTGRDMMVRFSSDRHTLDNDDDVYVRRGFHAVFTFQRLNDTTSVDDAQSRYVDIGGHSPDWSADLNYVDDGQGQGNVHDASRYTQANIVGRHSTLCRPAVNVGPCSLPAVIGSAHSSLAVLT